MTFPESSNQTRFRRRDLLKAGSLSLFGLGLPDLLEARDLQAAKQASEPLTESSFGRAKACILLFMWGGPAHQDTWDLKPDAPLEVRGEFQPISTKVPGIHICEHFPKLSKRTDQLCIVRSMSHTDVNHITAPAYLLTGQPPSPTGNIHHDWPHLGSVLAKINPPKGILPPFVSMRPKLHNTVPRFVEQTRGQFSGWLDKNYNPMTIDSNPGAEDYKVGDFDLPVEINATRLDRRKDLLAEIELQRKQFMENSVMSSMQSHYQRAFSLLDSATGKDAFDLSQESEEMRERYGQNPHGQSVLQARRLIERGVPLVTVFWPNDGIKNVSVYWDTHSRNFIDLKERLMPVADQAFSTLLDDLSDRGLLEETLVVWTGEFGRTPKVGQRNSDAGAGRDGRDHWPNCFSTVLAGAGIKTGQVYGASDQFAAYPASNRVLPVDLMATIHHTLGIPPHLELHDRLGRPLIACPGDPVQELLL